MSGPRDELALAEGALAMAMQAVQRARSALQAAPAGGTSPDAPLSVEEAATALRLRPPAIRLMCQKGRLPGAFKPVGGKSWLIPSAALEAVRSPAPAAPADLDARRRARAAELAAAALQGTR